MSASSSALGGDTLLGACLRAVRSLLRTELVSCPPAPDRRDFFGSPVRAAGIQAPWFEVLPNDPASAELFPPLEGGVPDACTPFELLDWEEIARSRKSGAHRVAHHLLVFLEILRCIASPITNAEGRRLSHGVCRPEVLPKEYFREDPDTPDDYIRATYTLRRSFFLLYGHLLLCRLSEGNEKLVRVVFDARDPNERMRRFHELLQRPAGVDEERWKALSTSAVLFVGSQTYSQSLMGAHNRSGLPQPTARGTGAPTKLYCKLYEEQFDLVEQIALPEPISLLLHLTLDDRSEGPTLPLLPKTLRQSAHILYDELRVERFERMLSDDAPWTRVRFTRRELWNGTTRPSFLYVSQAAFCVALEYLLGRDFSSLQPLMDPLLADADAENIDGTRGAKDLGLERQVAALGADIASSRRARASQPSEGRLLASEQAADFEFSRDGIATLTFGHAEGFSAPLVCTVQRGSSGSVPAGAIFVPIPRHLVVDRLWVEFHVFRFDSGVGGEAGWGMTPVAARLMDQFTVEDGVLVCIELDSVGGFGRVGEAFSDGGFVTRASMRMVAAADAGGEAVLCCVIACFE